MTAPLAALAGHERVIESNMRSYIEIGRALQAIRDGKLYLAVEPTWTLYLRRRWQWSPARAYQFIDGAAVAQLAIARGEAPPKNEGQARRRVGEIRTLRPRAVKAEPELTPAQIVAGLFRLYRPDVVREVARLIAARHQATA